MELLIATGNAGKVKEFRQMLAGDPDGGQFRLFDLDPAAAPLVEETCLTFCQNACLKATAYAMHFQKWAMADDSGLEIAALAGKPGIHSARWASLHGSGSGDGANNRLVLKQLTASGSADRSARFVCVLALSDPKGRIVATTAGFMSGTIIDEPRGTGGFGYDPLFLLPGLGKTTAELTAEQKHEISHRGAALRRMNGVLRRSDLTFT